MPLGFGGLFNCKTATHVLVPVGTSPIIPWFNRSPRPLSVSTRSVIRTLCEAGYAVLPGGKGSHIKLKKPGHPTLHVPANREALSPGVLRSVAEALGYPSIRDLAAVTQA
jgi:predicted RNA binding protein YcfA (HicA-like mRNA interferase family)